MEYGFGYIGIRSTYTPCSIYLRGSPEPYCGPKSPNLRAPHSRTLNRPTRHSLRMFIRTDVGVSTCCRARVHEWQEPKTINPKNPQLEALNCDTKPKPRTSTLNPKKEARASRRACYPPHLCRPLYGHYIEQS